MGPHPPPTLVSSPQSGSLASPREKGVFRFASRPWGKPLCQKGFAQVGSSAIRRRSHRIRRLARPSDHRGEHPPPPLPVPLQPLTSTDLADPASEPRQTRSLHPAPEPHPEPPSHP
ncbi:hypothetical protein DPEC_G00195560 [Dallia pectoralis]|uniref:Uncharacterized protein n=1 Tax=Dallia pectoralis TaxID=75939 RepID=A0ACC2G7I4_DALPE|nr:hypothetical protein DPEC_G00195560 [Dallia pectoralis]